MRSALVVAWLLGAGALAGCRGAAIESAAPAAEPTGIAMAAPGARGASFDPAPSPPKPSLPPVPPSMPPAPGMPPGMKGTPPDPFGGALPEPPEPELPTPGGHGQGVHL